MKKLIIISLFIIVGTLCYGQIIKGRVLDQSNQKAIIAANIYFNGTTTGTMSDEDGYFELDISNCKDMPLIISSMGYKSKSITNPTLDNLLTVFLTPKSYNLHEIRVVAKGLNTKRDQYMRLFKEQFLGLNHKKMKITIENEDDITFNYNTCKDTLEAIAMSPIRIMNKRLGYRITFFLDVFKHAWKTKETVYGGNYLFADTTLTNITLKSKYDKERFEVYQGSRLHFFRALWTYSLENENYFLTKFNRQPLNYNDVVSIEDGKKYLFYPEDIFIGRKLDPNLFKSPDTFNGIESDPIKYSFSRINFCSGKTYFNSEGYYDFYSIGWAGNMGNQKIADFLPYDYEAVNPEKTQTVKKLSTAKTDNQVTVDIGNATMECIYKYTIKAPLINSETNKKKLITYTTILQFNGLESKFWDWNLYKADSIRQNNSDEQFTKDEIQKMYNKHLTEKYVFSPIIFKNYPKGKITTLDELFPEEFIYQENMDEHLWELTNGTKTVCGHLCKKATMNFKERTWTVWYAPDLNFSEGPWKLCDLPGLILKAEDSTNAHRFEAVTIRKSNQPITKTVNINLTWIEKEEFNKLKMAFENGYIRQLPVSNATDGKTDNEVKIVNGKRFPIGCDTEYCPLELEKIIPDCP